MGHILAKLKPKLEHSFTEPSYCEVIMKPVWIRYSSMTHFPFTEFAFSSAVGCMITQCYLSNCKRDQIT